MLICQSRFAVGEDLTRQRLTARLVILLLITRRIMTSIYILFSIKVTRVILISHPSLEVYQKLFETDSSTLSWSCSQMSIAYKQFLLTNYTLHQICLSTSVFSSYDSTFICIDRFHWFSSDSALSSLIIVQCVLANSRYVAKKCLYQSTHPISITISRSHYDVLNQLQCNSDVSVFEIRCIWR